MTFICSLFPFIIAFAQWTSAFSEENETISRAFTITCCLGGTPEIDHSLSDDVLNYTVEARGPTSYKTGNQSCTKFQGSYSLPMTTVMRTQQSTVGVHCKCPKSDLDRNCRSLRECKNGGYKSFRINLNCVCSGAWFGDSCEYLCSSGALRKGSDGVDFCQCKPNFFGVECDNIQCYNRGTPAGRRHCTCRAPYVGKHCEIKLNSTSHLDGIRRSDRSFQRDLSGSVLSLFLILGLSFAVYFLVRKRTQMTYRRAILRDLFRANQRRGDENSPPSDWGLQVLTIPDGNYMGDPPPYQVINGTLLPPPPGYEEAIKLNNPQTNLCVEQGRESIPTVHPSDTVPQTSTPRDNSTGHEIVQKPENSTKSKGKTVVILIKQEENETN